MPNLPIEDLIAYLEWWQTNTSYEAVAMSEHRFSEFLRGLIETLEDEKDPSHD